VEEQQFWKLLIEKYLKPLKKDKESEAKVQRDLIELRNSAGFGFWMINLIWLILNFLLQSHVAPITLFFNNSKGQPIVCQPLAFVYIVFFLIIIGIQVGGMIKHRSDVV